MSYISSKISKASLNNTKYFLPTSIEYEKNVHSVLTTQDNNMTEQQNYSYGLPVQNDIYQYRYNSFYKGSRDVDLMPTPYTTLDLPETKPSDTSDTSSIKSKAPGVVVVNSIKSTPASTNAWANIRPSSVVLLRIIAINPEEKSTPPINSLLITGPVNLKICACLMLTP